MTVSRWLLFVISVLIFASCLQGERLTNPVRSCTCYGLRCLDGEVARLSPSNEENTCLGCHVDELGVCADGCGGSKAPIDGCYVGALCRSWDRVTEGAACTNDRDCEPGELRDGKPVRLSCNEGRCAAAPDKWTDQTLPAQACKGDPEFGAHPACGGAPCMPIDSLHSKRVCSVARCLDDRDCPSLWRCRCAEETDANGQLKAHRWCVPNLEGGFPDELIEPAP